MRNISTMGISKALLLRRPKRYGAHYIYLVRALSAVFPSISTLTLTA